MTQKDRGEVREIIHGILAGWEAKTVAREEVTNITLLKIDKHLEGINNKVAEHEKVINQNIPHTIAHCPQASNIENLKANMISEKAVKKTIYTSIVILGIIITAVWSLFELLK